MAETSSNEPCLKRAAWGWTETLPSLLLVPQKPALLGSKISYAMAIAHATRVLSCIHWWQRGVQHRKHLNICPLSTFPAVVCCVWCFCFAFGVMHHILLFRAHASCGMFYIFPWWARCGKRWPKWDILLWWVVLERDLAAAGLGSARWKDIRENGLFPRHVFFSGVFHTGLQPHILVSLPCKQLFLSQPTVSAW